MAFDGVDVTDHTDNSRQEEPESATVIVQDSALLSLPLEVLQTITRWMDAGTFFASLLTCKQLLKAAKCRPNLLRHLHSLPGLRLGLGNYSTSGLLVQFRKRAAESGCAAGVLSDVTTYSPNSRTSLSNAAFSPASPSQPNSHAHLATVNDGGIIHIYDLGKDQVRLKTELHIRPEDGSAARMEIVKMAFCSRSRDLAVLYRHLSSERGPLGKRGFFDCIPLDGTLFKLVTFHHVHTSTKGYFYDSHLQETRDIRSLDKEVPVGLALASNGLACIAWKKSGKEDNTRVTLTERDEKLMQACTYDENPDIVTIQDPPSLPSYIYKDRQIFSMQFVENDRKVNLYEPGKPVHRWYTATRVVEEESRGPMRNNTAIVPLDPDEERSGSEIFAIGMPFHGAHFDNLSVDGQTAILCQSSYLALGINKQRDQAEYAYILRAETHTATAVCRHTVTLDRGRKIFSWKATALLAGWRQGTSSLGTVVAISPGGSRIAAATWSRVLVWSFTPRFLHEGDLQHYFPVRDFNTRKGIGRLRPILLPSVGIIHSMQWIDETHLYATGDQGLVRFDIDHMSNCERESLTLRFDAWPDTAVIQPTVGSRMSTQSRTFS